MPASSPESPGPPGPASRRPSTPAAAARPGPPGPPKPPRSPGPRRPTALLLTSILAVLAAVLLLVFVLRLSHQPGGKLNLGTSEFDMGRASAFAPEVATNGPLIFPALYGSTITLYVQHLGKFPAEGWLAFNAHDPGQPASCLVRWRKAQQDFVDPCDQVVFPADGQGLDQYATQVDTSGDVIIDLHQPIGTTPPSTTPSTTRPTSVPEGATGLSETPTSGVPTPTTPTPTTPTPTPTTPTT